MSQLWRRAVNIAKSYINDSSSAFGSRSETEDEELRRIIDEISRENAADEAEGKTSNASGSSSQQGRRSNNQNQQKHTDGSMTVAEACKILEIPPSADVEAIKRGYKRQIRLYHPDRVATEDQKVRDVAAQRSRDINRAYAFLKKAHNFN